MGDESIGGFDLLSISLQASTCYTSAQVTRFPQRKHRLVYVLDHFREIGLLISLLGPMRES
jgi:hypothetical protein